jgi:hypothetical protein
MGILDGILGTSSEMRPEEIQRSFGHMLIEGESIQHAYKSFRDFFVFTNKRLILVDKQGYTGRKAEYFCIPYKSIAFFSLETAGTFDLDSELKIWVRGMGQPISKEFRKGNDLQNIYRLLSQHVL